MFAVIPLVSKVINGDINKESIQTFVKERPKLSAAIALGVVGYLGLKGLRKFKNRIRYNTILELELEGEYNYNPRNSLFEKVNKPADVFKLLQVLRKASKDPKIDGIVLTLGNFAMSLAIMQEFREVLQKFREEGKTVTCWMKSGFGNNLLSYWIASAANEVYVIPSTEMPLLPITIEKSFLKNFMDETAKTSLDFVRRRDYKGAIETFTMEDLSDPSKETYNGIINAIIEIVSRDIAESRSELTQEMVLDAINNGPYTKKNLLERKFLDGFKYRDEIYDAFKEKSLLYFNIYAKKTYKSIFVSQGDALSQTFPSYFNSVPIAYIPMVGAIMQGKSKPESWNDSPSTGEVSVCRWLREIRLLDHIKCVLLHVDSPGGDSNASSQILREIRKLKEKGVKIVTLMSGVAASGGYHVSCGSDLIIANPLTITGSIGVFILSPNLEKLYNYWGVTFGRLSSNIENSTLISSIRSWSQNDYEKMNEFCDDVYDMFKKDVAGCRNMAVEEVEKVAQGRVWMGMKAKELNLVDRFGGFHTAVEACKELIGVEKDVKILKFPKKKSFFEGLMSKPARNSDDFNNASSDDLFGSTSYVADLQRASGIIRTLKTQISILSDQRGMQMRSEQPAFV